ncbi:MAG: efflux RND transporter periplasmic adaptor subunit, partial [Nannocystaceae bacterium]
PLKKRSRRLLRAGFGGALLALTAGCGRPPPGGWGNAGGRMGAESGDAEEEEVAAPVLVGSAVTGPIAATVSSASTIEAERQVTVAAEATGQVTALGVEEGDTVEASDVLASLRRDTQATMLERAGVSVEKATRDLARAKELFAKGATSAEEVANFEVTLRNAKLDLRDRKRDVRNTRVRAPFAGVVTERFVNMGALVSSGAQLFTLTDFDSLVARIYVPERELDRISVGQPARVASKAAVGRNVEGTVVRIAPVVDASTGTVKVTVSLPGRDGQTRGGFLPGMYAEVTLTTERREGALLLAKSALVRRDEEVFAMIVEDNRAVERVLKVGLENADFVEVLSGIEVTDEVIMEGQTALKDGALIQRVDEHGTPLDADGDANSPVTDGVASARSDGADGGS